MNAKVATNAVYAVDQHGKTTGIKRGSEVLCNGGYPGHVTEVLAWSGNRMFEVRLERGEVCISCDDATLVKS